MGDRGWVWALTHPEFAENVRARLVNPRRNLDRTMNQVTRGDLKETRLYLITVIDQLTALAEYVDRENARHEHTCTCGNVHYVQGDDA